MRGPNAASLHGPVGVILSGYISQLQQLLAMIGCTFFICERFASCKPLNFPSEQSPRQEGVSWSKSTSFIDNDILTSSSQSTCSPVERALKWVALDRQAFCSSSCYR